MARFDELLTTIDVTSKKQNDITSVEIYLNTPGVSKQNIKNAEILIGEDQSNDVFQFEIAFEEDHELFPSFKKKYSYKLNTDLFYDNIIDDDIIESNNTTLKSYASMGIGPYLVRHLLRDTMVSVKRKVAGLDINVKDGITKVTIKLQDPVQNRQTVKATIN